MPHFSDKNKFTRFFIGLHNLRRLGAGLDKVIFLSNHHMGVYQGPFLAFLAQGLLICATKFIPRASISQKIQNTQEIIIRAVTILVKAFRVEYEQFHYLP